MEPDLQLVTVLETRDTFGLSLAKASLDEAGIDYLVTGDDPRYLAGIPGGVWGWCNPSVQLLLPDPSRA